jgi:hypothetical protein
VLAALHPLSLLTDHMRSFLTAFCRRLSACLRFQSLPSSDSFIVSQIGVVKACGSTCLPCSGRSCLAAHISIFNNNKTIGNASEPGFTQIVSASLSSQQRVCPLCQLVLTLWRHFSPLGISSRLSRSLLISVSPLFSVSPPRP